MCGVFGIFELPISLESSKSFDSVKSVCKLNFSINTWVTLSGMYTHNVIMHRDTYSFETEVKVGLLST